MLEATAAHASVIAGTLLALAACVLLQYEYLIFVWRRLSLHAGHRRVKVLYGIFSVILLHVVQIWAFGSMLFLLLLWPACGSLAGPSTSSLLECVYLSAVTFSTVGFGDVVPVGPIRFLSGTEALTGFVLITWSASFTYLEMEKFWRADEMNQRSGQERN
jgi:Ion channel